MSVSNIRFRFYLQNQNLVPVKYFPYILLNFHIPNINLLGLQLPDRCLCWCLNSNCLNWTQKLLFKRESSPIYCLSCSLDKFAGILVGIPGITALSVSSVFHLLFFFFFLPASSSVDPPGVHAPTETKKSKLHQWLLQKPGSNIGEGWRGQVKNQQLIIHL